MNICNFPKIVDIENVSYFINPEKVVAIMAFGDGTRIILDNTIEGKMMHIEVADEPEVVKDKIMAGVVRI